MNKAVYFIFVLALVVCNLIPTVHIIAQDAPAVLPMRARAALINELLEDRVKNLLPSLMDETAIDCWVLISREYNEDPVLKTMLPAEWLAARRRTIMIIHKAQNADTLGLYAIARYDVGSLFKRSWEKEQEPDQWQRTVDLLKALNPKKVAINYSETYGLADGIASTDRNEFTAYMSKVGLDKRIVSAEKLAVAWLETRTPREMAVYKHIMQIAHHIIGEGFSDEVITPGHTTTTDVEWWYRDRIRELGLVAWFHPTVDVQRAEPDAAETHPNFSKRPGADIIMPGDLLHVDFGITYLRFNTDTQELAYVLKSGEYEAPSYLEAALASGNAVQDHLTNAFAVGKSGNEILKEALTNGKNAGLRPWIYTHPIGYHGHAAGPAIGMWDAQGGVVGSGDYKMRPNTAYSIELNNTLFVKEWNKEVRILLEEDAFFDGNNLTYINGRQTKLMLIPRDKTYLRQDR